MSGLPSIAADATPEQLVDGLNDYLDAAELHLANKEMVELSGLDRVVEALCKRVEAMTVEEGRAYAAPLDKLSARLDVLQASMTELQQSLQKELNVINARAKAARAYAKES